MFTLVHKYLLNTCLLSVRLVIILLMFENYHFWLTCTVSWSWIMCGCISQLNRLFLCTFVFCFYAQFPSLSFSLQCETDWPHKVQSTHRLPTFLVSVSLGWGEMNNNLPYQCTPPLSSDCIGQQKYFWYLACMNFMP